MMEIIGRKNCNMNSTLQETETETVKYRLRKRANENRLDDLSCTKRRHSKETRTSSSESINESDSDIDKDGDSESNYSAISDNDHSDKSDNEENEILTTNSTAERTFRENSPVLVPVDPHVWTTEHVTSWVKWITHQFNIIPEPDIQRFPKTGAELCEMSRSDFWVCAGSRHGGCLLAKHFALTLYSATGRETSPMLNDNEPSECK